jgi:serine O-acetyltransferase
VHETYLDEIYLNFTRTQTNYSSEINMFLPYFSKQFMIWVIVNSINILMMRNSEMSDAQEKDKWSIPNWDREVPRGFWDPSRKLIKSIRDYQSVTRRGGLLNIIRSKPIVFRHKFWSMVCGAEIDLNTRIGGGLLLPHPNGIVIHPSSEIGINCMIFQQVTLAGKVILCDHVDLGSGAKIIGPLTIESDARVGANAVVTKNVEKGTTVVGIPAKVINP